MPILSGYHSRGRLPHIKVAGAAYFVTFRLADSLPSETVARLKERRDDLLRRVQQGIPDVHDRVRRELFAWYASEVDSVLDRHTGAAWLRDRRVAELVDRAVRFFQGDRYALHAWCVMPNHVHAVVQPLGPHALDSILHSWKSFTGHAANKLLGRAGTAFWQHESFDHWIRDGEDLSHCCHYTENNPVKAGLCDRSEDWPWSSAARK
jgi:REP element-mobilizing transposase RayT